MYYFMTFIVGVKLKVTRMSHRWQCRGWGGGGGGSRWATDVLCQMNAVAGRQEAVRQVLVGGIYIWDRVFLQSACFTAVLPPGPRYSCCLKKTRGLCRQPFFMPICLEPNVIFFFFFLENNQTKKIPSNGDGCPLTGHLHNVSRDDFSGLDHLHTLSVRTVNLAHLRLVLLKSLDGTFSIALLRVTHGRGDRTVETSYKCAYLNVAFRPSHILLGLGHLFEMFMFMKKMLVC